MRLKATILSGLAALALTACATTTGPEAVGRFDSFETVKTADFTSYKNVYIAPLKASSEVMDLVGYRTRGKSDPKRPLLARDIDSQLAELEDDLRKAIGAKATLVDSPAMASTLTIEVTVTELASNRPTQADIADNIGLSMESIYRGGAAVDVRFLDGETLLATATDSNVGDTQLEFISPSVWGEAKKFYLRVSDKISSLLG